MRRTIASVNCTALRQNLRMARELAPGSRQMAVIKANAYGHGALPVARALTADADAFAVAFLDEALQLRSGGIHKPILVLQGVRSTEEVTEAAARDLWLMVHDAEQLAQLRAAQTGNSAVPTLHVWLKLDTGMHRLGFDVDAAAKALDELALMPGIHQPVVLCTHLARAEEQQEDMTGGQAAACLALARQRHLPVSIANSAGVLYWPQTHAEWNRPGYMLYGACPAGSPGPHAHGLRPAMRLESEIIAVRQVQAGESVGYGGTWRASTPTLVGTVGIGYADGYPRHAPNGTPVLVNGRRARLAGRVTMDMLTVDLSGAGEVRVGDRVELWGEALGVNEVALSAGTIGYALLAGLTGRVRYVYED